MLHPLCIVISKHDRGFKVILEGGVLLWAKCIGQTLSAEAELGWINRSFLTSEDRCGWVILWFAHQVSLSSSHVTVTPSDAARNKGSSCARLAIVASSLAKGKFLSSSSEAAVGFRACTCTGQQRRAALKARTVPWNWTLNFWAGLFESRLTQTQD